MTVLLHNPVLIGRCAVEKDVISPNRSQHTHRFSPTKSNNQRKLWELILRSMDGLGMPVLQGTQRRRVQVTRLVSGRMRKLDTSNLYGAVKPLEDALVKLGWLKDDSDKYCVLVAEQISREDMGEAQVRLVEFGKKIQVEIFELPDVIR